ncbi:hypothetical protein Taro_018905 [Colocasia esculenta]|uniref:PHD-type zinc finger plants domain-containing protein n=1 Tax=Colocasia esculenta TaxID=4460 RepID=A0A843USA4_COLES|nr:hypothetical protein [Colocasia esculenta]
MGDLNTVCCMCGDVGFPDKLFRCARCSSRFQHSYCSNYYEDGGSSEAAGLCDWCRSEERNSSRAHARRTGSGKRADHSGGERAKQGGGGVDPEDGDGGRGKNTGGPPGMSTRPSGRRYKLLKDVLC